MPSKELRTICFSLRKAMTKASPFLVSNSSSSTPGSIFLDAAMYRSFMTAEAAIMKWNPENPKVAKATSLFHDNRREAMEFIECVIALQKSMQFLVARDPVPAELVRGQELMVIAMKRLQKEFYQILSLNRAHLDPESASARSSLASTRSCTSDYEDKGDENRAAGDSTSEVEDVSTSAMADLRSITECMILCGYGKECVSIYKVKRKSIIDEGIYKLGVQRLSSSHAQKLDWDSMELKIKTWLNAVKIAIKMFKEERILCHHVFGSSENILESCFTEISNEGAQILFGFPEIVVKSSKKAPEKVFRLLDMYSAISQNWPKIESILSFKSSSSIRSQAVNSLIKIGESVRTAISEFESVIQKDASGAPSTDGGVHPLTVQVMNYLTLLADHSNILNDILNGYSLSGRSSLPESLFNSSDSEESKPAPATSLLFAWLILILLCKLDTKGRQYSDETFSYLFLANNLQHIITKARAWNLRFIFGHDWLSKHEIKLKQFAANYERLGWDHVVKSLPENPATAMSPEEVRKHFTRFNTAFGQAHCKQSTHVVPDIMLRDSIKESIAKKIVPVYRNFYDAHKVVAFGPGNLNFAVRFAPEDVANYLSDLYIGTAGLGASSSSSSSPSHSRPSRSS